MPFVTGAYGSDCDKTVFASCGSRKEIAADLKRYCGRALREDYSLEEYEEQEYCEFSDYRALGTTDETELEKILRKYRFSLGELYVYVSAYAGDTFEELSALLKSEFGFEAFEEPSSYDEAKKLFFQLASKYTLF